ncbi:MAG: hypothetical protein P4L81_08105 [Candidatus Pacebacteria bacterium]|nr:hypothetical protein [Candidatus Paceibacterota bacterium]
MLDAFVVVVVVVLLPLVHDHFRKCFPVRDHWEYNDSKELIANLEASLITLLPLLSDSHRRLREAEARTDRQLLDVELLEKQ